MRYLLVIHARVPDPNLAGNPDLEEGEDDTMLEILPPVEMDYASDVEWYIKNQLKPGEDWALFEKVKGKFVRRSITFAVIA